MCLNGDYGEISRYCNFEAADMVICADGGTGPALALGLTPDLIVGDMDSIDAELLAKMQAQGVSTQVFSTEKDKTDTQLALEAAVSRGADQITILGGIGDRLDHTWSTIMSTVDWVYRGIKISFYNPNQSIYIVKGEGEVSLQGKPGEIVSLLALTVVFGVTTEGLKYPLSRAELQPYQPYTVSNELVGERATVAFTNGVLMVVHITD